MQAKGGTAFYVSREYLITSVGKVIQGDTVGGSIYRIHLHERSRVQVSLKRFIDCRNKLEADTIVIQSSLVRRNNYEGGTMSTTSPKAKKIPIQERSVRIG